MISTKILPNSINRNMFLKAEGILDLDELLSKVRVAEFLPN